MADARRHIGIGERNIGLIGELTDKGHAAAFASGRKGRLALREIQREQGRVGNIDVDDTFRRAAKAVIGRKADRSRARIASGRREQDATPVSGKSRRSAGCPDDPEIETVSIGIGCQLGQVDIALQVDMGFFRRNGGGDQG